MSPLSWEGWAARYAAKGFRVVARGWPGMDRPPAELRRDPSEIAKHEIGAIVDHYAGIIRALDRPPIVMGHSFGGAFVQLLLDRGLGAAGVAIHPGAVKGVLPLPFTTLRSAWPILKNPFNHGRAVALTHEQFHYSFTNTLSEADSRAVYQRQHVPGSGRVLFQGALANFNPNAATRVNFRNDTRAPLLLVAGTADQLIPPVLVKFAANLHRRSKAVTDYKEYPGRSHYTCGEPGWEAVADDALAWAAQAVRGAARAA